jgi:DNA-binding MarR family transcriptional regulator
MSSGNLARAQLEAALNHAGREMSTATIMFHSALAQQLGLNVTDWKCIDLVDRFGPLSAGKLAELTGLTSGAITGVVDRLEKAGFVRREPDPHDRRRVIIRAVYDRMAELETVFGSFVAALDDLNARYSEAELVLIRDYMQNAIAVMQREAAKLNARLRTPGA